MDERVLCGRGGSGGGGGALFSGRDNAAGIACPLEWKEGQPFSDTGGPVMEY